MNVHIIFRGGKLLKEPPAFNKKMDRLWTDISRVSHAVPLPVLYSLCSCSMEAILENIAVVSQFYIYNAFTIFAIMDDKTQTLKENEEKEMVHTYFKVRNLNGSEWLEPSKWLNRGLKWASF